jgi:hypothetical protein
MVTLEQVQAVQLPGFFRFSGNIQGLRCRSMQLVGKVIACNTGTELGLGLASCKVRPVECVDCPDFVPLHLMGNLTPG